MIFRFSCGLRRRSLRRPCYPARGSKKLPRTRTSAWSGFAGTRLLRKRGRSPRFRRTFSWWRSFNTASSTRFAWPILPSVFAWPASNPPTGSGPRRRMRRLGSWPGALTFGSRREPTCPKRKRIGCWLPRYCESSAPSRPARIAPPSKALEAARSILKRHAIDEGAYWVVCAGARPGLETKDWGEENWIAALSHIASETQASLLFLGNEKESSSIERIRGGLPKGSKHFSLASPPPSILATLGIIALSAGFVGRDSGPMQLAAASQRPILAIFGEAHWGRFFPDAKAAVIVSREVPCRGCLGYCHLPEPFCVRRVTVQQFLEGWKLLRTEPINGNRIIECPWTTP